MASYVPPKSSLMEVDIRAGGAPVSSTNPVPNNLVDVVSGNNLIVNADGSISITPSRGTFTDRSGVIAAGGASQTLMPINLSRKRIFVQNPQTATEALFINFTAPAGITNNSIVLMAGASFDTGMGPVTTELVTINAATTGHSFIAKEM